jgi:cysteine desulfurase/selenocysteine lyase
MHAKLGDRSLFPNLEARAYLSHAAISPPSTLVRAAVDEVLDAYAARGVHAFGQFLQQRQQLRHSIATLVNAAVDDIAFVPNTTRGVTDIALCFPWRKRDRIIVADGEFPANVTPWQRAAQLYDLEVVMIPRPHADGIDGWMADLERELRHERARLFAVSAVQFQTGLRMPMTQIGEKCASYDVQLFVDAIQGCGAVDVDVRRDRIDYLSCGGHKWLMGLEGVGFLYVSPNRVAELRPHVAGWLSHEDALLFLFEGRDQLRYDRPIRQKADMIEGGISNSVGCAALAASVGAILDIGVANIAAHIDRYFAAVEAPLIERGFRSLRASDPHLRSGILSFEPPDGVDIVALYGAIDPAKVSCTTPDGLLRFAPHWPNAMDEVEGVVAAIDEACRALKPPTR